MNTALSQSTERRYRWLIVFGALQLLDFATTMIILARGGVELNPAVRQLIPIFGPVAGVLMSKLMICFLVWRFSRRLFVLYIGNFIYALVVGWNLLAVISSL